MKKTITKVLAMGMAAMMLASCSAGDGQTAGKKDTYKIGITQYADHPSLDNCRKGFIEGLKENGFVEGENLEIDYQAAQANDSMNTQIAQSFANSGMDLVCGIATPSAQALYVACKEKNIPVIFNAISDPVGAGLVQSLETPGSNVTGTSDYLDTTAIMNPIFAADPDAAKIGLLYDAGQDSSTAAIASAKAYLDEKGITYVEHTGSTADEVMLAAQAMVADGVDAVFTPTDNSIMKAELAIYETFIDAGIPQYTGADSFALNGAFLGYGVDYANLGRETADMIADILLNGADPASTPVKTFDNGTAVINTETCAALGLDFDTVSKAFEPYCTKISTLTTAESFS